MSDTADLEWLTTAEAAERLGISPHTLRAYAYRGQTTMRHQRHTVAGMVRLYWHPGDVADNQVRRDEQGQVDASAKLLAGGPHGVSLAAAKLLVVRAGVESV